MADGLNALVIPTSTSEFHAMVNAARAHHRAMHGQDSDIAAALRVVLPEVISARGGTRSGLFGRDAKIMASRIVRPIMDAAALNDMIARLYVQSYNRYVQYVVNATRATTRPRFDVER